MSSRESSSCHPSSSLSLRCLRLIRGACEDKAGDAQPVAPVSEDLQCIPRAAADCAAFSPPANLRASIAADFSSSNLALPGGKWCGEGEWSALARPETSRQRRLQRHGLVMRAARTRRYGDCNSTALCRKRCEGQLAHVKGSTQRLHRPDRRRKRSSAVQ